MAKAIAREIREEIMSRVKEGKETIVGIACQYGVKVNTIYGWVQDGASGVTSQVVSNNRLKRENESLKKIIGELVFERERGKKG
jgi:transposase-like protein